MKVNTEQMDALLRLQEQQSAPASRKAGKGGSFDALFSSELGAASGAQASAAPLPPGAAQAGLISELLLHPVQATQSAEPLNAEDAVMQAAFEQASGTLDMWDDYAKTLSASSASGNLRDAYALLEGIGNEVASLRQNTADVRGKNPGFDSILNELEVLATTERFKFNRGDYNS